MTQRTAKKNQHRHGADELLDRQLPSDDDAEKALLGSLILDTSRYADVATVVRSNDFRVLAHRCIFDAIGEIHRSGAVVDSALLVNTLKAQGNWRSEDNLSADVPDMAMLVELFERTPHAGNAVSHATAITRTSTQRRMVIAGLELLRFGHDKQRASEDISGLMAEVRAVVGRVTAGCEATAPRLFESITSEELDSSDYEQEFLVKGTLVAGQPCVVAGAKKSLKTSLLIDLGVSLAIGGFFLGKMKVNRACRTAMMSGESGLATIQETARRVCHAAGRNLSDMSNLIWSDKLPKFGNAMHMEGLRLFLTDGEVEVLIIDPAYLCLPGADAGNLFSQGELLQGMNEVCQSAGVTLILAHHTKKGVIDPTKPPELEDISWSGFQEWARQWMLIGRRELYEPGSGHHKLWLNIGGSAGHSALWALDIDEGVYNPDTLRTWNVTVKNPPDARQEAEMCREEAKEQRQADQLEADKKSILNTVAGLPGRMGTKTDIKTRSHRNSQAFAAAFAELLDDGELVPCTLTKNRNRTYEGFTLVGESNP